MRSFRINNLEIPPDSRSYSRLSIGQLAGGYELSLPLHVIHGSHKGPTLLLVGVIHGEEILAIDAIRNALKRIDPKALRGTLLAVPVANPPALASQVRNTPLDMLDLNRQFPGNSEGWLSERIAARLAQLVERSDCLLHMDGGSTDKIIHYVFLNNTSGNASAESEQLSQAFGMRTLYRGPQAPGSLTSYAMEKGLPCVLAMIGGGMLYSEPQFLESATCGILRVMSKLGMIKRELPLIGEQITLTKRTLIRVPQGGIFHPKVGIEILDEQVSGGTVLGVIMDPYSLEQIAEIRAPYKRSALLQLRVLPSAVQPGDYAYIAADLDSAEAT